MSLLTYNGITLPYAATTKFDQQPIRDDMGDTDWCGTKFDIQVQCVITNDYITAIYPTLAGMVNPETLSPADIMKVIRQKLLQNRKQLSFTFNGSELIPTAVVGNVGTVDAENGPKPQSCTLMELSNTTYLLSYHITATYWENLNIVGGNRVTITNQPANNVLFNRWSESMEMDSCNFVTRRRDGKFKIRSDNADGVIAAQAIPQMGIVGVPPGFLRKSSRYTVDPSGLAIQYSVVDQEVFKMPPVPAYEAQGEYTESSTRGGAVRYGEVRVYLKGSKTTGQGELIRTAVSIAAAKIRLNTPGFNINKAIPEFAAMRVGMWENDVEVRIKVKFGVSEKKLAGLTFTDGKPDGGGGGQGQYLIIVPGVDGVNPPTPSYNIEGTASRLLRAAAYYDPSLRNTKIQGEFSQLSTGLEPGQAGKTAE